MAGCARLRSRAQLAHVDGVMIGREAYENPWSLTAFQADITGAPDKTAPRAEIVEAMARYVERQARAGVPDRAVTRHMLGLFNGCPARARLAPRLTWQMRRTGRSCCGPLPTWSRSRRSWRLNASLRLCL